ncbi:MAG: cytidylate kinase-like family protein [Thermodesulfobacteriota bacterium]|jgi:cytidylate kinase
MSVVTIRGQLGSGAPEIGKQVAERLHADYIDREIIAKVAARLQRQEAEVGEKEMPASSLLGRIAEALEYSYASDVGSAGAYLPTWEIPLNDARYLQALESVVRELARSPSIVIRGRGSQFILKDHPATLHVLVVAPLEVRLKRVMEDLKLDQKAAKQEIERFDNSRHEFIKRYFHAEMEDPAYYDLVINTERFSFQASTSIIVDALAFKVRT